ncbi:MAG: hypothetical protein QM703_19415 [Gemmatales bacterium]
MIHDAIRQKMPCFQFGFGFESPRQFHNNAAHGWDDENSQEVLILADDEASAIRWGREISERFIQLLFKDESVSWKKLGYANWIEPHCEGQEDQQLVVVGEYPDFSSWLRPYAGET